MLIRSARRRRGWSQDNLALRLVMVGLDSVDRTQVSRWERDERTPGPHSRERLALVLDLPADRLDQAARVSRARRRALNRK